MKKFWVIGVIAPAVVAATAVFSLRESYGYYDRPAPRTAAAAQPAAQEFRMASSNFSFNPQKMTLAQGRPVKITFQNTGVHTFTVDELGVDIPLRGSTAVAEFTPSKAGTFAYYCKVPGHRERGMVGSLTVQ